jgi:hypothetical protein
MTSIETIPGWRDKSGAELLAFSQANPQTSQPVPAAPMQKWLRLNDLLMRVDGVFTGLIPTIAANPQTPPDMARKIRGMLSEFEENPLAAIETNSDEYAPLFAWLMGSVSLPSAEIAKFYALGGGRKYPEFADEAEATAAQAAAIAAADRLAAKSAIETRAGAASFAAAASYDAGDGADAITAAGEAAWEAE